MRFGIARRLFVIVLSVALAAGLVAHSVQAIAMDGKAPAAAAIMDPGMPVSDKCSGCAGSEKATMSAACSAFCGSAFVLPPIVVAVDPVPVDTVGPWATPTATGHAFPPDPYPPRPSILS